jgi:hypothetical protein
LRWTARKQGIQQLFHYYQLKLPINRFKRAEVQEVMNSLNPKKSSGYDLITGKILKELPIIGMKYLIQLLDTVNPKKSSGYELITGKILKKLPIIGIKYLIQLLHTVLLKEYFSEQWEVARIILILKPENPPNELTSYWPIDKPLPHSI